MMGLAPASFPPPTARPAPASGRRRASSGVELASKTLGIIGCGNIGSIVATGRRG
jgi:phosphoglycerate dehydrogenase-like enzyme